MTVSSWGYEDEKPDAASYAIFFNPVSLYNESAPLVSLMSFTNFTQSGKSSFLYRPR